MKIKTTLLVFMLVLPLGAQGQSLFDSPHAETRLWCPGDIETFYAELQIEPTRFGLNHPATRIAESAEGSAARWRDLPATDWRFWSCCSAIRRINRGA